MLNIFLEITGSNIYMNPTLPASLRLMLFGDCYAVIQSTHIVITIKFKSPKCFSNVSQEEMENPVSSLYKRTYGIYIVPRLGLEPRCLAALVFETSASTYSAIWAKEVDNECNVGAKVQ